MKKIIFMLTGLLLLSGCQQNPLGIKDEQWQLMTLEQRLQAQAQQASLDEKARERRHQEALLKQQQLEEKQRQKAILRQQAAVGDLIDCSLSAVSVKANGKWQEGISHAISLLKDDEESIALVSKKHNHQSVAFTMSFDGLNVRVCDAYGRRCDQLSATGQAWMRGVKGSIQTDYLQAQMYCQYPPSKPFYYRR